MAKEEKFWDRQAGGYAKQVNEDDKLSLHAIAIAKEYLKENDTVLDFGCGTGLIANEIAGFVGQVQGIDVSAEMIKIADEERQRRGIQNVTFTQATLFDDRLNQGTFDAILAFNILHLAGDEADISKRLFDLLKPGGYLITTTPSMGESSRFFAIFLKLFGKIGLVPTIKSFKFSEIDGFLSSANLQILHTEVWPDSVPNYIVVASKP